MSTTFPAIDPTRAKALAAERIADVATEAAELRQAAEQALEAYNRGEVELAEQLIESAKKPAGIASARVAWAQSALAVARELGGG